MDANKLKKLQEVNYKVHSTCQMCKYRKFPSRSSWGECLLHTYDHLKHTASKRNVSIHVSGGCDEFEVDKDTIMLLENSGFDSLAEWNNPICANQSCARLAEFTGVSTEYCKPCWLKGDL